MPRRTTHHRSYSTSNPISRFLRRPVIQFGIVLAVVVFIVLVILIGGQKPETTLPDEISTARAYELYQQKGAYFLDVREQSEWDSIHIPETNLIPLGDLPNRLGEVPRDRPIVVVCRTGNRSASGRDILRAAGYSDVTSMAGGVTEWKSLGYPIQP